MMAWSEEQISTYQIHNKQMLAEVNATLQPDKNLSGKVGIGLPGQAGDLMTAMSVLKYRDQIFPGKEIIWFANQPNCDCLKYAPISEVRPWPWPGNGLPHDAVGDYYPIVCNENNRLNKELAKNYEDLADLDEMYFPAPWMLAPQKRHGIDYPNCSRKVFGVQDDYEWHPLLNFSSDEENDAFYFIKNELGEPDWMVDGDYVPNKRIFFETFAGSDQSKLSHEMVIETMRICKEKWPDCNIIFASHKYLRNQESFPEGWFEQEGVQSCASFTVRQCALIAEHCDLMISVSSGITVAASAWGLKSPPILQYCGSKICSTAALANGPFELVTADNKNLQTAQTEFMFRLESLLNQYK